MIRTKYVLNDNLVHAARIYMDNKHTAEDIKADMDISIALGILVGEPYMEVDPWMLDARLRRQYPEIAQMEHMTDAKCSGKHTDGEQKRRLQADIAGIYGNVLMRHRIILSLGELLERKIDEESFHSSNTNLG